MDYSKTVNLPETDFPMKADLPNREPGILKKWNEEDAYNKIQNERKDSPSYILHDGPPYANGHIHIGHALNKILKDIIIKHKTMSGFRSPYVPGWDCHGLPIELQVGKQLGEKARSMSKAEIRTKCREYAKEFIDIQREEFKRLGVFADYENPYLTMSNDYEATIARKFGELFKQGYIYKGKKPIYWCPSCETALAEAEVEYGNHTSESVYVKFPIEKSSLSLEGVDSSSAFAVIWTTTPWTLPANLAVCLHPDFDYSFYKYGSEWYLLADGLAEKFEADNNLKREKSVKADKKTVAALKVNHPFIKRESKVIFGSHVTLEAGTGIVHTAPGHGMEDYIVGLQFGLDVFCPVDHQGRYTNDYSEMQGEKVFAANDKIVEKLRNDGSLISSAKIEHSYPHCWRCKKPLIFRATEQWFLGIDANDLRKKGITSVDETKWIPKWGESRFRGMVETRPDWCLSRQRSWGVPIPSVKCTKCGKNSTTAESIFHFAELAEKKGIDIWYTEDVKNLIPDGFKCSCGSDTFEKEYDILDVWFDSGVSHFAVLDKREKLSWPADLYLEGSDQHRGWFQSSLWPAVALKGKAPFKTVLTHGFVLDESGKAMSKSIGNVVPPEKIISQYGADVLRLWVASEDYRNDLRIGFDMMKQIADSYRKIRNTFKFLIGNISDFDPSKQKAEYKDLSEISKWILNNLYKLNKECIDSYEKFEFHLVYRKLLNFCAVDLSSVYFDNSKDILYTEAKNSPKRRAEQTVIYEIFNTLLRLSAPILAFTAEEIWQFGDNKGTIHSEKYYELDSVYNNPEVEERINKLVNVKKDLMKALEDQRKKNLIGKSIEAKVEIFVEDAALSAMMKEKIEDVTRFFQVCRVDVADKTEGLEKYDFCFIKAGKADGKKCVRCWNYFEKLGDDPEHPELCKRCASAVKEMTK